jgi:hypothetical protein
MVLQPITLIQLFQPLARVACTFKAETELPLTQQRTLVFHMQAIFPPGNTAAAICFMKTLFVYIVFLKLIGNTQTAIHPAGSDEILFQRVINLSVHKQMALILT